MSTRSRKSIFLALTLMAAQAAALAGMIGAAALIEAEGSRLELEKPVLVEAEAPSEQCLRCSDPLRLILF